MARPEKISDVSDKMVRVATFEVDKITALPALMKPYVALVDAVQKIRGEVLTSYGSTVEIVIPKNHKQLQEQLKSDQYSWDNRKESYDKVLRGEKVPSYTEHGLKEWAKDEGLPEPQFVKDDPEEAEAS